jgi:prephenate dehydrogenase
MPRTLPLVDASRPDGGPPPFEKVGVVGLGLVGGSIALACRRRWPTCLVIGVDANGPLEQATVRHAIDVGADDLGMLREADLVVLAAPVGENIAILEQLPQFVPGEALVTDVGSTKRTTVAAARRLPARLTFIGGHPLAGGARGSITFASADMFEGRPWFLTPLTEPDPPLARLSAWVEALGAVPQVISAADHDRILAYLSHLPQLVASALMRAVGDAVGAEALRYAGPGLADTTRLATSPSSIWTDICESNAEELGRALDLLIEELRRTRDGLARERVIAELFDSAAAWRRQIDREARSHD